MKKQRFSQICIVVLFFTLLLTGCNNDNQNNDNTEETVSTTIKDQTTSVQITTTIPQESTTPEPETTTGPVYDEVEAPRKGTEILADRALTAVDLAGGLGAEVNVTAEGVKGVYLSWRYMTGDNDNTRFTLYKNGNIVADNLKKTNYTDIDGEYGDI